jgi:hypothetical protein
MSLHQFAWFLWVVGTIFVVLSWTGTVTPTAGWAGFVVALVGVLLSQFRQGEDDRLAYPLTQEGFPVEPSGVAVPADLRLEVGTPVLAYSQGRWWRATVVSAEDEEEVVIGYPGWDPEWAERVPRKRLQLDLDERRAPSPPLPEDDEGRRAAQPNPEGVRPSGSYDGFQDGKGGASRNG